jgi:hypothetical protein
MSGAEAANPRNEFACGADERCMNDVVTFLREGATFFWRALCPSCRSEVTESVVLPLASCGACGRRMAVDLLRMRIRAPR